MIFSLFKSQSVLSIGFQDVRQKKLFDSNAEVLEAEVKKERLYSDTNSKTDCPIQTAAKNTTKSLRGRRSKGRCKSQVTQKLQST